MTLTLYLKAAWHDYQRRRYREKVNESRTWMVVNESHMWHHEYKLKQIKRALDKQQPYDIRADEPASVGAVGQRVE